LLRRGVSDCAAAGTVDSESGFRAGAAAAKPFVVRAGGGPERIRARERQGGLQALGAAPRHLGGMYHRCCSLPLDALIFLNERSVHRFS